ncbi:uncharacterized protein LOC106162832 isoform X1 [Lingula anatina]|uniref:Uncharacterized protein LOC106162832 isoform X1 n=2 Tax=Lingula anatina TaxID=7574 RepID=A0A2R2MPN6_LINAN|nr:uncharacterized protein LOC106162832 isoform X1 [Lingula anatina]|eukprot:XP_023931977.1 uncharacterized protein LOC106162832 isoform X1 [Lingula anatina]
MGKRKPGKSRNHGWFKRKQETITVTAGNDDNSNIEMLMKQLTSQRELVEKLDSEPLFEYLVQNGVLEKGVVDEIKKEKSAAKVNLALLRHLENSTPKEFGLFMNGLRQTGQHELANLLDDGKRIRPSGSPDFMGKGRQKGQVSLKILVNGVKIDPSKEPGLSCSKREWLHLEDIKPESKPLPRTRSIELMEIQDIREDQKSVKKKSSKCLCFCFMRSFTKGSKKERKRTESYSAYVVGNGNNHSVPPGGQKDKTGNEGKNGAHPDTDGAITNGNGQITNRNQPPKTVDPALKKVFENKSELFYKEVQEASCQTHVDFVKYLEQMRGILFMQINTDSDLSVICICMKLSQLTQLRQDWRNGNLLKDVESCLVNDTILQVIGAKGLKLQVELQEEELNFAEQELST